MAGRVRYLLNRDGRYFARLVVPKDLRPALDGLTELRTPLGADYRVAIRNLPGAVADLQHRIAVAERKSTCKPAAAMPPRYPLRAEEIAAVNYRVQLDFDEELRRSDWRYAAMGIDDIRLDDLRAAVAGRPGVRGRG